MGGEKKEENKDPHKAANRYSEHILNENYQPNKSPYQGLQKWETRAEFEVGEASREIRMQSLKKYKNNIRAVRKTRLNHTDQLLLDTNKRLDKIPPFKSTNSGLVYIFPKNSSNLNTITRRQILDGLTKNYERFKTKYTKNLSKKPNILYYSGTRTVNVKRLAAEEKERQLAIQNHAFPAERRNSVEYLEHDEFTKKRVNNDEVVIVEKTLKEMVLPTLQGHTDRLTMKMYEVCTDKLEDQIIDFKVREQIRHKLMDEMTTEFAITESTNHTGDQSKEIKHKAGEWSKQNLEDLKSKIIPKVSRVTLDKGIT